MYLVSSLPLSIPGNHRQPLQATARRASLISGVMVQPPERVWLVMSTPNPHRRAVPNVTAQAARSGEACEVAVFDLLPLRPAGTGARHYDDVDGHVVLLTAHFSPRFLSHSPLYPRSGLQSRSFSNYGVSMAWMWPLRRRRRLVVRARSRVRSAVGLRLA